MDGNDLPIPPLLVAALESGRWPRTDAEVRAQNLRSLVPADRIRCLAPDEDWLYLYSPPFATVASLVATERFPFWTTFGAVDQLVPEATLVIGDFGMGSDAPIVLDYRDSKTDPRVLRLHWPEPGSPNVWKLMAPDFPTFLDVLGL